MLFIEVNNFRIEEPDLTKVYRRGMGFRGFEFEGISMEEKGKLIVEKLEKLRGEKNIKWKAFADDGKELVGYGTLEEFNSECDQSKIPVEFRFSGIVNFIK